MRIIHKFAWLFLSFLLILTFPYVSLSQEIDQAAWQKLHDELAVDIIKLLSRSDSLSAKIDSLKIILDEKSSNLELCEDDMLALVGKTKTSIVDFRRKFEETERKINNKTGSPADVRESYFDEISDDKAICLPEFSARFMSMKRKLEDWEGKPLYTTTPINPGGETYVVVKGDCLFSIARLKYGSLYFWSLIWEANRNGVANESRFRDRKLQTIEDPDHIYPGQELYLPPINPSQEKEIENKLKNSWKERKQKPR
jgi:hypothetical protein